MIQFKEYTFHGNRVMAHCLVFPDKEGISYSHNQDGLPYITTTIGQEYFAPGDYIVKTLDGEIERVYKKDSFEPFAKEVESVETVQKVNGRSADGTDARRDVHGQIRPADSGGNVRVADDEAKAVGKAHVGRRRRAAQRRTGNHERDAGRPHR